ncbi:DUF4190 domain-containing protein [Nocardia farcinica]|uniref:DUF4190 domain-containing protein n=1 Tax=Nocardia farcinica TaxID=37329 RepID=UPI001E50FCDB|nr:DUF4190 domain-containing protein [Nocardia farcinica]
MNAPTPAEYRQDDHRTSPAWLCFLIPLVLGTVWMATSYFGSGIVVFGYSPEDLGAWNFLIALLLIIVGAIGVVITRSTSARPTTTTAARPYDPRTNSLAIVALVLGFVFPFAAIPIGHIARAQIRTSGEQGAGLALTGLVLGYLWLLFVAMIITLIALANSG